jgi:hypothetical protein
VQKTLPHWAFYVLAFAGTVLIGSMLLSWISLVGWEMSGLRVAWEEDHWLFFVPLAGAALLVTAATKSKYTRLAALFAGLVVTGYTLLDVAQSIFDSGLDTWLILGGAGAMLVGASRDRRAWRAIGGIAVLAGFFAPWDNHSLCKVLTSGYAGFATALWLVPLAGVAGLVATVHERAAKLAAIAGIAIYGAFVFVIVRLAYAVFGWGAWAALGASTVALVIGVLARAGNRTAPAA